MDKALQVVRLDRALQVALLGERREEDGVQRRGLLESEVACQEADAMRLEARWAAQQGGLAKGHTEGELA